MGMTQTLAQTIRKIPIFTGLSPKQVQRVLNICRMREFDSMAVIYSANAPSDDMHILITGELSVVNSEGIRLARIYPVTTVGEMGLITRQARSASVEVSKPSTMMVLQRSPFETLLRTDPDLQIKIYRNIIDILASKISGDNVRVRDYLVEKVDHQRELRGVRRRLDTVQNLLLAETGMSEEEMQVRIEEELVPAQMRVLIVDDEPGICQFVREALPGYQVDEANDGIEALKAVESAPPDLIITDIRMKHMDGPALLKAVRSKLPNLPIIALSGYVEAKDLEAFDFDGFIRKPFDLSEFRSLVDEAVCGGQEPA